jgi:large repetitive protein
MCDAAPTQVTAQVFQADGVTPVSAPLVEDTDFSVTFAGAPDCTLRITMLSEAAAVTAGNRMIVRYQAQLDADSQTNATFTNIAGATEWFSADPSSPQTAGQSVTYTRVLTDGTVGLLDHEDAHTVNVPALRFEKTVANVTTSLNPAVEATPGDRLRYSLRITNLGDAALSNFSVRDEIDRLNANAAFEPGTLTLVTVPSGRRHKQHERHGRRAGHGSARRTQPDARPAAGSLLLEFEVTLAPVLANSSDVLNQSQLLASGAVLALSDDPNIDGAADPEHPDDEDPTRVRIVSAPAFRVLKTPRRDRRPGRAACRRDAALHHHGAERRHGQRPRCAAARPGAGEHDLRRRQHDAERRAGRGCGGPVAARERPGAQLAGQRNAGHDAGWRSRRHNPTSRPSPSTSSSIRRVVDGTVISNQGFVSSPAGGVTDQPSDDPDTPIVDDPTRDVVGQPAAAVCGQAGGPVRRPGLAGHRRSGRRVALHDHRAELCRDAGDGSRAGRRGPGQHDLRGELDAAERLAFGQPDGGTAPLAAGIDLGHADRRRQRRSCSSTCVSTTAHLPGT